MLEIKSGIYCFENLINNKKYIGQAQEIENRIKGHLNLLKYNCDDSSALQNAYNKYKLENFEIWIVEFCVIELLSEREKYWIKELHSHVSENGYNISWGGENGLRGYKHSEEDRKQTSERQKGERGYWFGKEVSNEIRRKIGDAQLGEKNHNFGKKATKETKEKMSKAKKGIKFSEEHRNNLAIANKNRVLSDKERQEKSDERRGRKIIKNSSSIYVGVWYNKQNKKWQSSISVLNDKRYYLGSFKYEVEAAMAYNEFASEIYGWKAKLNVITPEQIEELWNLEI